MWSLLARRRVVNSVLVASRMGVAGKFRTEVYGRSASLAVETTHREIERTGKNIGGDLEGWALSSAGYFHEVFAGLLKAGEVSHVHGIASIGIECRGAEFAFQDYRSIRDPLEFE